MSNCCISPRLVHADSDVVCSNCGVVSDDLIEGSEVMQTSKIMPCDESRLGSADISPSSILHSKRQQIILKSRQNPYEKKLYDVCSALSLSHNTTRRALYLFRAIRQTKKIPLANTAFFCIWQTCKENGIDVENNAIISAVTQCFALIRVIRPKKAIFMAQSVLLDSDRQIYLPTSSVRDGDDDLRKINSEVSRRIALRLFKKDSLFKNAVAIVQHLDRS